MFRKTKDGLEERQHVAGLLLGPITDTFWQNSRVWRADAYFGLGIIQDLLGRLPDVSWSLHPGKRTARVCDSLFHTRAWQSIAAPSGPLGAVGLLHPRIARAWDLERENAVLFYLDCDRLCELSVPGRRFVSYGLFPSVKRDLSILVLEKTDFVSVLGAVQEAKIKESRVELVDLFTGKGVPPGQKSLTLRFTFSRDDRTLRDEEVARVMEDLLEALKKHVGATLRS